MKNAVASEAAATPKLIDICCIVLAMVLAMLVSLSRDIGIDQRIHARVLQRGEKPETKGLKHDEPDRRARPDRGEQHEDQRR